MQLLFLRLNNFRCYDEAVFEFSPGINIIRGHNAAGKTSLLEAIYTLITGASFRPAQLNNLIKKETDRFFLEVSFLKHGIEQTLKMSCSAEERRVIHNSTTCSSFGALLGLLQGVVTSPDDAELVKGAPTIRRRFLDIQIAQVDPLYVHHLTRYHRALRHRNALLRSKNIATIESWENEMAISAAYVVVQRMKTAKDLAQHGKHYYHQLTEQQEELSLQYKTHAPTETVEEAKAYYAHQLHKLRPRELVFGNTLTGPQKDDVRIELSQQEARFFASEGQQRSIVAALRLAEWRQLNELAQEKPLMLMDDFGMSLDEKRREKLFQQLDHLGQVFMTTIHDMSALAGANAKLFHMATS